MESTNPEFSKSISAEETIDEMDIKGTCKLTAAYF